MPLSVQLFIIAYSALVVLSPPTITYSPKDGWYLTPSDHTQKHALPSLYDEPSLDLSVVIPAYNESTRITSMLESALKHLATIPSRTFEILIIDDGSKDDTASVALSSPSNILPKLLASSQLKESNLEFRVVKLSRNRGKGAAVKYGVMHARGRRILMVDADDASQFSDLELLWKAIDQVELDGEGIAVGSRAHLVDTEAVVKVSRPSPPKLWPQSHQDCEP